MFQDSHPLNEFVNPKLGSGKIPDATAAPAFCDGAATDATTLYSLRVGVAHVACAKKSVMKYGMGNKFRG